MIAVREQVVRAFAALLDGLVDQRGYDIAVHRGRDAMISETPALVIEEGQETAREPSYPRLDLTMSITVYGYVREDADEGDVDNAGADYEAAKTDLYARTLQAVMADRQLGGLADDVRFLLMTPEIAEEAGTRAGTITLQFEVDYWTSDSNPYTQTLGG